jgi:hypothetical protein
MTIRTPSSLQWLIDKRARLHGDLLRHEKSLARYIKQADQEIEKINQDLLQAYARRNQKVLATHDLIEEAKIGLRIIDSAIGMHEVRIDPKIIPPIRTVKRLSKERYGSLTRLIVDALHNARGSPLQTKEIAVYIAEIKPIEYDSKDLRILTERVRYRLKNLCNQNRVIRIEAGHWLLPGYEAVSRQTVT